MVVRVFRWGNVMEEGRTYLISISTRPCSVRGACTRLAVLGLRFDSPGTGPGAAGFCLGEMGGDGWWVWKMHVVGYHMGVVGVVGVS